MGAQLATTSLPGGDGASLAPYDRIFIVVIIFIGAELGEDLGDDSVAP